SGYLLKRGCHDRSPATQRHDAEDPHRMSSWEDRTLIEDVLANGLDDWVYAGWVYQIAQRSGLNDPSELRALAIGLIAEVLTGGLMVAGEYDGTKHAQWACSTGEAIERITKAWL